MLTTVEDPSIAKSSFHLEVYSMYCTLIHCNEIPSISQLAPQYSESHSSQFILIWVCAWQMETFHLIFNLFSVFVEKEKQKS